MEAKKYRRIFTIVVDSCGIGGAKDAERFGDAGTDTLGHIAETVGNLSIPNMQKLGIANLKELKNIAPVENQWDILQDFLRRATERYHDRTLGNDGTSYYQAIFDVYRARFSKGTDR